MNGYEIWVEGFAITGSYSGASLVAKVSGITFEIACANYFKGVGDKSYNSEDNTLWGCRLFSNEEEARKSFD